MEELKSATRPATVEELKADAAAVAAELQQHGGGADNVGGGSLHRRLPEDLRRRFVGVRQALFARGVFEPMLARFDSATVTPASNQEIGERLAAIAESLG